MPPPRKIDLIPQDLRDRLAQLLRENGYGEQLAATDAINAWLREAGVEMTIGKSAIGNYALELKAQREAFDFASAMLDGFDIERESELHKVLLQMIATSAVRLMRDAHGDGEAQFDSKDLMQLSKMLKDLIASSGIREKLLEGERERVRKEERERAAENAESVVQKYGLTAERAAELRRELVGMSS